MAYTNAEAQARWRTRRKAERALLAERLRTWSNAVANFDCVPEDMPGIAREMLEQAERLERSMSLRSVSEGKRA